MRRRKRGFTITEVLVSIAVLTISLTGVLAALAYDAFSADQSGMQTYAVNYTRRVLDLMQSGQVDPTAPGFITATTPASISSNANNDGTNWRDLDAPPLNPGLIWGAAGSVELQRFQIEKQRYGINLAARRLVPNSSAEPNVALRYKNLLLEITATTRWRQRRGFRFVRMRGFCVTSEQP
ncbi:prepilin-type N-terminal cleavage/methylation domain-containing protein [bacterium]|nr:prepilin-type N-terminal cleavage/methylation domain-containing protein [bacterium]